jgi:CubicO group peptidase (beta-lactamase class C family)
MMRPKFALAVALLALAAITSVQSAEIDKQKLSRIPAAMQRFVEKEEIAGAVTLVGRRDGVVSLEAVGSQDLDAHKPMEKDTLFRIASMTKPMTAAAIMILVDEGKLSVDDPVEKHLPEFRGQKLMKDGKLVEPKRPIQIRDLLTHTSGLPGGLPPDLADLYRLRNRLLAEAVPQFAKRPLEFEPGTKWAYCNLGIDTLGRIIEVASGKSYEDFLRERLFEPLDMNDTCFYPKPSQALRIAATYGVEGGKLKQVKSDILGSPSGAVYPIPAGGAYSTAADLARFYRMMLSGGALDGRRILSSQSAAAMTRVQTGEITTGFVPGMGFGFGWAVVRSPSGVTEMLSKGTYGHGGAFGTQGWIDPTKDLFVVLLIQRVGLPNADASDMRRELQSIAVSAVK